MPFIRILLALGLAILLCGTTSGTTAAAQTSAPFLTMQSASSGSFGAVIVAPDSARLATLVDTFAISRDIFDVAYAALEPGGYQWTVDDLELILTGLRQDSLGITLPAMMDEEVELELYALHSQVLNDSLLMADLEAALDSLDAAAAAGEQLIAEQDSIIASHDAIVAAQDSTIAANQAIIAAQADSVANLEETVATLQGDVDATLARIDELDNFLAYTLDRVRTVLSGLKR